MSKQFNRKLITIPVALIAVLLLCNIVFTYTNNQVIEENRRIEQQSELVKQTLSQFAIVIIHNLDLGLRGYALFGKDKYLFPMRFALEDKDSLMDIVEAQLVEQEYPLPEFRALRDSINAYAAFTTMLLQLYRNGELDKFFALSDMDKGYHLWLQYETLARKVNAFEDDRIERAYLRYNAALRNNYFVQLILFLISVPTLIFTATNTIRKFTIERKLQAAEMEKAAILAAQNELLEKTVAARTAEIEKQHRLLQTQYEEINAQNEEIISQNEELNRHREILALQNQELRESKRRQLELHRDNLMEKSRLLDQVTEELEILRKRFTPDQEHIRKLNQILSFNILTDEDWERFKRTFQEVYPDFFAGLRYRFPAITASETRLAALIKISLSLKEAANMLGISADSVKKSRYRLKKRLGLQDEQSLEEFLSRFPGPDATHPVIAQE
ncbi:MAG: hypothetical protein HC859_00175 [Bacteroidia bacterium]|nr:hypothetical protein [Bacteroidia bacterium]